MQAIYDAIQNAYAKKGVPSCIVLDTCKGKGATFAEPKHDHSSQPNEEQWAEAIAASEQASGSYQERLRRVRAMSVKANWKA